MQRHTASNQSVPKHKRARHRSTVSTRDLIDQPVYDINDEVIGRLVEIEFEAARGMVSYVIVGCDGRRDCVLPFDLVELSTNPPKIRARVQRSVFLGRS